MIVMALPVAPILLMPFIIVFFIVVFPLWVVAVAVLGLVMWLLRGIDALLKTRMASPISSAFHWTLSWGGLAERRDRPREG
ncbi:MAG: hypothetical protein JWL61_3528 [Gemmatimonadetes bacterium]|jgi:hypothetical protein|nr:hypothetical protein [Gemmatimonadota bacterium]